MGTWFFLLYCCCCMASLSMAAHSNSNLTTDQSALLALKARITSDPHNMILTNWSTTTHVCNWVGVTCAARHFRVAVLNLSYMGLTSTIPPELGNLSFLVKLSLKNNSFYGTLPPQLGRLRRLKLISFSSNNFMGAIPSWFGSLSKLEIFSLYGNQFSGSIPAAIFNLSALQVINLCYNQLSGSIPREIGNLTKLRELYLDSNNFEEIPNEIGALDQLESLFVQFNSLEGHVPLAVFNMSCLTTLTFYRNNLNGHLPDNICQHLPSIQELNLAYNQFDGSLPSKWSQCRQLLNLELSNNSFSGSIPREVGNLTKLKELRLERNHFKEIPNEIATLDQLEELIVEFNALKGPIPTAFFNMSSLTNLSFFGNSLTGSLPDNICQHMPSIQHLYLSFNRLDGPIPSKWSQCKQLILLEMGHNSFSGSIPTNIGNLTQIKLLDLDSNYLTGTMPIEIGYLPKLEALYLQDNNLSDLIPSSIFNMSTITMMALAINQLSGSIPPNIGLGLPNLQQIYLSENKLSGCIPNNIGNLSSLIVLALQDNQLSRTIPSSVGRLQNLQGFFLNHNNLQGHIPDELCQLNHLYHLFLHENQFSGPIPFCLGNLTGALRSLSLGFNLLNSTIPSTLWELTYILELYLSSNSLIGPLSEGIGNLKVVRVIELSNNRLSGTIPSSIDGLQSLVNLSLENNNLQGPIPSSLGTLISLEFLDFSRNNLSGLIPKSLEMLSHLKYMNLSFNRLQGEIPTDGPFRNFSAQSFVSNDGLCGASRFYVPSCKRETRRSILKYVIPEILSAVFLVTTVWMLMLRRKNNVEALTDTALMPQLLCRRVSYQELLSATNVFNKSNLLGIGGFGSVYKGTLSDEKNVAIKVFNLELEGAFTSFEVECEVLSNVRHRNLIKAIGCCNQIDFKAIILDYMPNGSLEKWLYSPKFSLNILQRLNIMIDVASALQYLHYDYETPIVHCDLKPSNILLDDDKVAHVSDFGIAKLLGGGDCMTQTITLATIGYMAPEYGMKGIITRRGDVYSFGIVLLETFTTKKPTDEMFTGEMSLKQWVTNSLFADAIVEVVDTNLLGIEEDHASVSKIECLSSIMRLALACCSESPEERINMQEALAVLNKIKIKFLKDSA